MAVAGTLAAALGRGYPERATSCRGPALRWNPPDGNARNAARYSERMAKKKSHSLTSLGQRPISHAAAPNPQLQTTGQPLTPYDNATEPYLQRGTIPVPGMPGPGGPPLGYPGVAGWGG